MPAALPYSKQTPGRTFVIAISVLGLVALTQIGALGWAFVKKAKKGPQLATTAAAGTAAVPALAASSSVSSPPVGGDADTTETLTFTSPFDDEEKDPTAPIMPPPKPLPMPLARLQPAPDSRFGELVQQGKILRERGDTSNALIKFREAYALEPRNPAGIAEIAVTFEKMGLPNKAAEQWRRILDMGESAGVYHSAAEAKLKEAVMTTQASLQGEPEGTPGTLANATLAVGLIETEEIRNPKALKHLLLRVPIRLRNKTRIIAKDVAIQVLFYDMVGDKPQRTNAQVTDRFSTAPVDWREDDTEVLEVEYNQPIPDPRDPQREARQYYGYIVRVYYKDELQATRAEPAQLGQTFPASRTLEKDLPQ